MTITLTDEQIALIIVALNATAGMSRQYGHDQQADTFGAIANEVERQRLAQ